MRLFPQGLAKGKRGKIPLVVFSIERKVYHFVLFSICWARAQSLPASGGWSSEKAIQELMSPHSAVFATSEWKCPIYKVIFMHWETRRTFVSSCWSLHMWSRSLGKVNIPQGQTLCMKSPQDRIKTLKPSDREPQDCFLTGILQIQPFCTTRSASPCFMTTYGWVIIRARSGKKPYGTCLFSEFSLVVRQHG